MTREEEVQKLAALARVSVPEGNLAAFASDFDAILAYVGKLDALSLEHGKPAAGVVRNVFRKDDEAHAKGAYTKKLAEQFPEREGDHLSVKQIISYD